MKNIFRIFITIGLLMSFASCEEESNKEVITLGMVNWEENMAMGQVAKTVMEEKGYEVQFRYADIQPIFNNLLPRQKIDVFMDVWMPTTHKSYMEEYKDEIEVLGNTYKNAKTGLVVPKYVSINSIDELNDNANQFGYKIHGIDVGAGIMKNTENVIDAYNLQLELIPSTNFAMLTALKQALEQEKWIVITGWTPHSIFSRFELKFLEDDKGIFEEAETIQSVAYKGFSEDYPEITEFFKNMKFDEDEMASLLKVMEEEKHDFEAAEKWIKEHRETVDSWWPDNT